MKARRHASRQPHPCDGAILDVTRRQHPAFGALILCVRHDGNDVAVVLAGRADPPGKGSFAGEARISVVEALAAAGLLRDGTDFPVGSAGSRLRRGDHADAINAAAVTGDDADGAARDESIADGLSRVGGEQTK